MYTKKLTNVNKPKALLLLKRFHSNLIEHLNNNKLLSDQCTKTVIFDIL